MPGSITSNFHEGSRSEYLAQYIFAQLGTAIPVPHQEDSGIDLYCTLTEHVGQQAWPRSHFTVQVKSSVGPWVFQGENSVRWLIEHPHPLFLCVVDKKNISFKIWHTMPRFYLWSFPPLPDDLELVPEEQHTGRCTQWKNSDSKFSLSAPIIDMSLQQMLSDEFQFKMRQVLTFWIEYDKANLHRINSGIRRFVMPDNYKTNTTDIGPTIIQFKNNLDDINLLLENSKELLHWLGFQLRLKEDVTGAVLAALLSRHLFPKEWSAHDSQLHTDINKMFGQTEFTYGTVDKLLADISAKLCEARERQHLEVEQRNA